MDQREKLPIMRSPLAAGLALGLAVLLGACTGRPAESLPMTPAPPSRAPPPPVAGAISIRFSPEGAAALGQVAEVVADATVSGGAGRLRLWVDFVAPGGTTYQRAGAEVDALPAGAEQSVALSVPISGTEAARYPGAWTAVLIGPEGRLASASFALQEVAP
ncbi:MAG TPA: hypothetical protein VND93_22220 [Myxococcales bacterium]|nr:hypothetical protein [Myxococcales bacterium]